MKKIINQLNDCIENGKNVVLTTIIDNQGSSPRHIGSMMISDMEGNLIAGTIGGGAIEKQALMDSIDVFKWNEACKKTYTLKESSPLEMACGGEVTLLMQAFMSPNLLIIGGGHIGKALVHYSEILDYRVTLIDHRQDFANPERFPNITSLSGDIVEQLKTLNLGPNTYVVIMTHGHIFDEVALRYLIEKELAYIGMIGSSAKIKLIMNKLLKEGISQALVDRVYAPIGLNLGGESPQEIALGIMSQIQSIRYQTKTVHYKDVKYERD